MTRFFQWTDWSKTGRDRLRRIALMTGLFCAGGATVALAQAGVLKLFINGKLASTRVRMLDGTAYVPVSDVAKGLGQNVVTVPGGYGITLPGGANEVTGLNGTVGDVLFDGFWRFQVDKVTEAQTYEERYTMDGKQNWKADAGGKLILVDVTLKNGMKIANSLVMYSNDEKILTSLAGADGSSIKFNNFDMRTGSGKHYGGGGDWDCTPAMLPGSLQKFTVIFKVPGDFKANALIFTLPYAEKQFAPRKYTHLRISLLPKAE